MTDSAAAPNAERILITYLPKDDDNAAEWYYGRGALAGGVRPFKRRYTTIWP